MIESDLGDKIVDSRDLVVVSAGLSSPSSSRLLGERLAEATATRLQESMITTRPTFVELRDHAMAITQNLLQGFGTPELEEMIDVVVSADAAIFVTPIFSAGVSGLFKSFIDILEPDSLVDLPVVIGATGGTERHSLTLEFGLRPLMTYLRADVAVTGVFAATSDWGSGGAHVASGLPKRIDRAAAELAGLVIQSSRRSTAPPSAALPDFQPPPMEYA